MSGSQAVATADLTPTSTYQDLPGASITLGAGTWLINAQVRQDGIASNTLSARLYDSTNGVVLQETANSQFSGASLAYPLCALVTLSGSTTLKIQVKSPAAGFSFRAGVDYGYPSSWINAVEVASGSQALATADLTLNTSYQDVSGCSLTLGAGTYLINAMIYCDNGSAHQMMSRVYNSTDGVALAYGELALNSGYGGAHGISALVTLTGAKTIKLQAKQEGGSFNVRWGATGNPLTLINAVAVTDSSPVIAGGSPSTTVNEGANYSFSLLASGGVGPYTYSDPSGSLPLGVTINSSTGVVSGFPLIVGTYPVTLRVADSNRMTADLSFTLTVSNFAGTTPADSTAITVDATTHSTDEN